MKTSSPVAGPSLLSMYLCMLVLNSTFTPLAAAGCAAVLVPHKSMPYLPCTVPNPLSQSASASSPP